MRRPLRTPSQTSGPYFPIGMLWDPAMPMLAGRDDPGRRIRLEGRVLDGAGEPLRDVLIELWQADPDGRYRHPLDRWDDATSTGFTGFGRSGIGADGCFRLDTVRPGPVPLPDGRRQAPHLTLLVFGKGLLDHLTTRVYFPDEPLNAEDPTLARVPGDRRSTLVARWGSADGTILTFDVVLQGAAETVFFDA